MEMLIVCVILSVVSLAIYSTFSSGLRIWKRVDGGIEDEEMVLFCERFGEDLQGTVMVRDIVFTGTDVKIEIPVVLNGRRMGKRAPGRVTYVFDQEKESVRRGQADYSDIYTGKTGSEREVFGKVTQAKFSYYRYDKDKKRYEWQDAWPAGDPPLAVRVEFSRRGHEGTATRTFGIPVAHKEI